MRENILNGTLKPGSRLVIRKIAQELGVSAIPVREAIRSLQVQGLVTMTPHAGAQVSTLDIDEIKDIMELRSILEGYATRSIIPVKANTKTKLQQCMKKMKKCIDENNLSGFGVLNREFHNIIYQQTPNKKLLSMIEEVLHASERTRAVFNLSAQRVTQAYQEHQDILDALLAEDGDKAEELVRMHRQRVGQIIVDCVKEQQEKESNQVL